LATDELFAQFRSYLASPLETLAKRGWHLAFSQVEIGATMPSGCVSDYMATSRPMHTDAAEVFFISKPDASSPKGTVAVSDHNFIKMAFHVQPFADTEGRSFFDDLCLLSSFSMDLGGEFARRIVTWEDPQCQNQIRRDAQKPYAVDKLAYLLFAAPVAAFDVLEVLKVAPQVKQPGHHPISRRSSMWHLPLNQAMRCTYQPDVGLEPRSGVKWPHWSFDGLAEVKFPNWHKEFVPEPRENLGRQDHIYQVDVKVLLMPNIIDIDILMSLARIWPVHSGVFKKMTGNAILSCLWSHLLKHVYLVDLMFTAIELCVLLSWGLTPSTYLILPGEVWDEASRSSGNPPLSAPFSWSILVAAVIRDTVNLGWWFSMYCFKWLHRPDYEKLQDSDAEATDTSPKVSAPKGFAARLRTLCDLEARHSLWHPWGFFSETSACFEIMAMLCLVFFIAMVSQRPGHVQGETLDDMSDRQHAWLSANIVFQGSKALFQLRLLSSFGLTVLPVIKAVMSWASFAMLGLTSVLFFSSCVIFQTLKRQDSFFSIFMSLFRGLIFGDGDGLDAMNLKAEALANDTLEKDLLFFIMFMAAVLIYVIVLNLLIAVYNDEYGKTVETAESDFVRERAKACCKYLCSQQKLRLATTGQDQQRLHYGRIAAPLVYFVALLVCFILPGSVSALFLALVQVVWQSIWMQSDWFLAEGDRAGEDFYLWICHRADYDEERVSVPARTRDLERASDVFNAKLKRIETEVSGRMDSLHRKLDHIDKRFSSRLEALGKQMGIQVGQLGSQLDAKLRANASAASLNAFSTNSFVTPMNSAREGTFVQTPQPRHRVVPLPSRLFPPVPRRQISTGTRGQSLGP